jgi:hypothetical protein
MIVISVVVNIVTLCYVLFVIPKRVRINGNKLDTIAKNQGIIERKIEKK